MIQIDEAFVDLAAPNANAIKNGRGLVRKNKFLHLYRSKDDTLLFGECKGSGKSNYHSSSDFIAPESPVHRCSCPSRQFPCKHCLGLMYAYVMGRTFEQNEIPEDVARKREKIKKRAENKKKGVQKPRKVNKSALKKKIKVQLDGLDLLETLTRDLIRSGLGNMNAKTARQIEERAKQLGNAYLTGAQNALHDFTSLFYKKDDIKEELGASEREAVYSEALDRLTRLESLCRRGRTYLANRLNDPELAPETETTIAAWLGHAWQLQELGELGLVQKEASLVQLAFNVFDDMGRKQFLETGAWVNLSDGAIQLTHNIRPYRAAKYIKEEDSIFNVVQPTELFIYPGDMNPRVRYKEMLQRPLESKDCQTIRSHAKREFPPVIKAVKNQLKSPLADKTPLALLWFHRIGKVGDAVVMEDEGGRRLVMEETDVLNEPESVSLLTMLPTEFLREQAILVRFHHHLDERTLRVKPLSIITDSEIHRLTL